MRKRIFQIIEIAKDGDTISKIYDIFMLIIIIISMIPIAMKDNDNIFKIIEYSTTAIFCVDYVLHFVTADFRNNKGYKSFIIYPFTPMAIIDLLSILPAITSISSTFRILKIFRLIKTIKVFRVFKVVRYSKSVNIIINVFKRQKESFIVVLGLATGYILISALVIISVEPDTFPTFFDAVYWAAISLTTVGYGDIYAVSVIGRIITMLSSILGIAIIALPAGIITAGYLDELKQIHKENEKQKSKTNKPQ